MPADKICTNHFNLNRKSSESAQPNPKMAANEIRTHLLNLKRSGSCKTCNPKTDYAS
jgi:hypothetical protein